MFNLTNSNEVAKNASTTKTKFMCQLVERFTGIKYIITIKAMVLLLESDEIVSWAVFLTIQTKNKFEMKCYHMIVEQCEIKYSISRYDTNSMQFFLAVAQLNFAICVLKVSVTILIYMNLLWLIWIQYRCYLLCLPGLLQSLMFIFPIDGL